MLGFLVASIFFMRVCSVGNKGSLLLFLQRGCDYNVYREVEMREFEERNLDMYRRDDGHNSLTLH
jgi:hypothetical protein